MAETAKLSAVVVWIKLPGLPIEYYKPSVLRDIGLAIGPVLRIDTQTATEARGHFARLCVQVNFDKPIIKLIKLGGIRQPVQYEGINALCFSCGRVGHKTEGCPYRVILPEQVEKTMGESEAPGSHELGKDHVEPVSGDFGPCVLVARKRKPRKNTSKENRALSQIGKTFPYPSQPNCVLSPTNELAQSNLGLSKESHLRCDVTEESEKRADHNSHFLNREKPSSKLKFQKGKAPSHKHQYKKNQAEIDGQNALRQKAPTKWQIVNSNVFGSSTPLNFGNDLANISTIGMEFKGY